MDLVNSYFKTLIFTQIEEKEEFFMYGAGIACGLGGGKRRYIFLFVPKQFATERQARIHNLRWRNLQAREILHSYNLKQQAWFITRDAKDILLEIQDRNKKSSMYTVSEQTKRENNGFPFEVSLLHDPKKKTIYQYRNKLSLISAIEMFNTVFDYTGEFYSANSVISPPAITGNFAEPTGLDDSFELL